MPNRLTKARPTHSKKHMPSFSIHQDGNDSDVLVSILSSDSAQAAKSSTSTPKSPVTTPRSSPMPTPTATPTKKKTAAQDRSSHRPTLSQASDGVINASPRSVNGGGAHGKPPSGAVSRMNSTIRPVRSFEDKEDKEDRTSEDSTTEGTSSSRSTRNSAFSSSIHSNASGMSATSTSQQETDKGNQSPHSSRRLKPSPMAAKPEEAASTTTQEIPRISEPQQQQQQQQQQSPNSMERRGSGAEAQQRGGSSNLSPSTMTAPSNNANTNANTNANADGGHHPPADAHSPDGGNSNWDSTVGKAGLGKTGRVINRLVSDNDALKRDLQIERLRAEESKQTAKLLEDKMERMVSEYESRLLEANVTKTLLARKERQVESLQSTVELERQRAVDARQREHTWKDEMERAQADAKQQVETAGNLAALMEGRYNAISSHWRDQGDEVKRAVGRMKEEIAALLEERRKDDDRIGTLRDLCDQQDGNIRALRQQKDDIAAQFERYKAEQEQALRGIKDKASQREAEQEKLLADTREVLNKLRWALNVKDKIEWAQ